MSTNYELISLAAISLIAVQLIIKVWHWISTFSIERAAKQFIADRMVDVEGDQPIPQHINKRKQIAIAMADAAVEKFGVMSHCEANVKVYEKFIRDLLEKTDLRLRDRLVVRELAVAMCFIPLDERVEMLSIMNTTAYGRRVTSGIRHVV